MAPRKSTPAARRIPLTQGRYALVDAADYPWLTRWRWCYSPNGYALRTLRTRFGNGLFHERHVYMHRQVLEVHERLWHIGDLVVDHINRNKLDNRRTNLRLITHPANMRNLNGRGPSGIAGVRQRESGRWQARVVVLYREVHLGTYDTFEEAVAARLRYVTDLDG